MAVALRGSAAVPTGNPTTSFTVTIDAAVQAGDQLYLAATSRDHTSGTALATCTDNDSGGNTWTLVGNSTDRKAYLFTKKATSATAGKTVTFAGAVGSSSGVLKAFSGVASGDPTTNFLVTANAAADETDAGFTPSAANAMLCASIHNYANDNAVTSLTSATYGAMTQTEKLSTGGSDCATAFGHDLMSGSSATGNITWAQTDGTTYSIHWAVKQPDPVTGSGGVDLDAPTVSGAGVERMTGTGGVDLNAPAAAASAVERFTGSGGIDLDAPTIAATGTHTSSGVTGTGALAISAPGVTGAGTEAIRGTATVDLNAPAVTSSGVLRLAGSGGVDINAPGVAGTGTEAIRGTGDVEINVPAIEGFGAPPGVTGTGATNIDAPAVSGAGVLRFVGVGGLELDAPGVVSAGAVRIYGEGAAAVDAPTLVALGAIRILGTGGLTLRAPAVAGSGTSSAPGSAPPLPDVVVATITSVGAITVGPLATGTNGSTVDEVGEIRGTIEVGA